MNQIDERHVGTDKIKAGPITRHQTGAMVDQKFTSTSGSEIQLAYQLAKGVGFAVAFILPGPKRLCWYSAATHRSAANPSARDC